MLDFVSALVDARYTQVAVPAFNRHFAGVAHAAVNMYWCVEDGIGDIRTVEFCHTCRVAVIQSLIDFPGGVQCQPFRGLNLHSRIGYHPLDGLAISDGLTKGNTLLGIVYRHLQQTFGRANAVRSNDPPSLPDPLHTKREAFSDLSQYVVFWHAHILEEEFGRIPAAHPGYRSRSPAHRAIHKEAGYTAVLRRLRAVRDGENHGKIGLIAACDKYLLPVDDPVAAVLDGARANGGGVGTRSWLCQGEARLACSLYGGYKVFSLLPFVALIEDSVGVSTDVKGYQRSAKFYHDEGCHDRAEVRAAVFLRGVDAPEAHHPGLHLERAIQRWFDAN